MADSTSSCPEARQHTTEQEARDSGSILNFMAARKTGTAMWVMRWYAVFLSIQYMFFCSAFNMAQYFQRAIIANGVVCALRLHQRVPEFRVTRRHLSLILQEDSAHYLIFSLIFLMSHPITIALVPIALFALLHACSFTRQLIDMRGGNSFPILRKVINHVAKNQAGVFRFVALNEVIIFPTVIIMTIWGRSSIFAPFLYYKFLHYRYLSKRNPYSRVVFFELRMSMEQMIRSPNCPAILGSVIRQVIVICSKLGPSISPDQPEI